MSDITREQLSKMTPTQIDEAMREGRLAHLGIGAGPDRWGFSVPAEIPKDEPYVREDGEKFTEADVAQMTPGQRSKAYADGKLDHLVGF